MKDEATEHEFIGFDPERATRFTKARYFKMLKDADIHLSEEEKKKIKKNIFKKKKT